MEIQVKIVGWLLLGLGAFHAVFPKRFKWKAQLENIELVNRQLMYVHTFFIGLTLAMMGILCIAEAQALTSSELGKTICVGFGLFWFIRLLFQWFVFSPFLWKGKMVETTIHITFTVLWTYFTAVFLIAGLFHS